MPTTTPDGVPPLTMKEKKNEKGFQMRSDCNEQAICKCHKFTLELMQIDTTSYSIRY